MGEGVEGSKKIRFVELRVDTFSINNNEILNKNKKMSRTCGLLSNLNHSIDNI